MAFLQHYFITALAACCAVYTDGIRFAGGIGGIGSAGIVELVDILTKKRKSGVITESEFLEEYLNISKIIEEENLKKRK